MRVTFKAYDEIKPLRDLKESRFQRNRHPKDQIKRLAKIMREHGVSQPIHIAVVGGENLGEIAFGHGRKEAALCNKWNEYPVVYLEFKDLDEYYAKVQSDNAIAHWSELDLADINQDVADLGPDFDIDLLGIKDFVIEPAEKYDAQCDEDEVPEHTEAKTKLGDLWLLGEHRLLCGDALKDADKLGDLKRGLLLTDPPYGIDVVKFDGNGGGNRKSGKVGYAKAGQYGAKASCRVYKPIIGDDKPFDPSFLMAIGDDQIIWGANNFASKLNDNSHWLVWDKKMPEKNNFSDAELAWTSFDKKNVKTYVFGWAGMIREGDRKDELVNRVHPTQKPVGLMANIINDYSKEKGVVIDLFGGSGSTLIAAEKTNRKCYMMELDPHYCDVIISRYEKYTGTKARLS